MKKIESEVRVWRGTGNGWFIEVKDQYTENRLAVTTEELYEIGRQIAEKYGHL